MFHEFQCFYFKMTNCITLHWLYCMKLLSFFTWNKYIEISTGWITHLKSLIPFINSPALLCQHWKKKISTAFIGIKSIFKKICLKYTIKPKCSSFGGNSDLDTTLDQRFSYILCYKYYWSQPKGRVKYGETCN